MQYKLIVKFTLAIFTHFISLEIPDALKTNIRKICENYLILNLPYKHQNSINELSKNRDIIVTRQDKGRSEAMLDRRHSVEKYLSVLKKNFKILQLT